jgi:hypothetical protein
MPNELDNLPDAILANGDVMPLGAGQLVAGERERRVRIPGRVGVVACRCFNL